MLVVSAQTDLDEKALMDCFTRYSKKVRIRSRSVTKRGSEWIVEMNTKQDAQLLRDVLSITGVISANLLSHDGDLRV